MKKNVTAFSFHTELQQLGFQPFIGNLDVESEY